MSARTTEFIALYREYMEPTGSSSALFGFIDVLRFDEARDCTLAYFDLDQEYEDWDWARTAGVSAEDMRKALQASLDEVEIQDPQLA